MIIIDGSEGEGGGQVLRTALSLSLVTGQAFRIDNIRAKRDKPGLMRQHLTAVEAICAISGATADGAAIGAASVTFTPGRVRAGDYTFAVGTAGSTGLVLQALLPPLLLADGPSRLVLEGGTHAHAAPPFDFTAQTFLPLLSRMGPAVTATLVRPGFFPVGGGRIEVSVAPAPLRQMAFMERGTLRGVSGRALLSNLPANIAERELAAARQVLDWPEEAWSVETVVEGRGPGNILMLSACFDQVTEVVSAVGRIGVRAEDIGRQTANRLAGYIASGAFAGPYLADQLLLPLALAGGGCFTTVRPTQHSLTGAAIIRRFLDRDIRFQAREDGTHLVTVA
ncbi:RNA 3'-terminal phosphate cyclase [Nitrospirillum viridazoti]|uniref:RNA 3'-terminal phosphate cyclase n=1 Tax=Nitrospirillum amazonense TaxID=28077 RepID=A0A560IWK2_9PROT|nr:RNA 3'-terminal phosphate cyclase [Nitrospirillum amazonense]TWB63443.1 RNA 3'-terminal phosphate cyclase (ATP) [Nitrospirillum amazonense]